MTKKTPAPKVREGVSKPKAPVREGLAFLIEDALERSEVVIAAEAIIEKLQGIAEELSTIEAKDIMPLLDAMTASFGPNVAQKFNSVATEQVRQLISTVQTAKTAMDGEIMRMKKGIETGQVDDMSMDVDPAAPMMPAAGPETMAADPAMGAEPPMEPGMAQPGLDDTPPEGGDETLIGGDFSGRSKKESAQPRGKPLAGKPTRSISEDVGMPHSHESANFGANLSNLTMFHGGAGRLAQGIANMIRTEELSLDQRKGFASVLSHMAAFAAEPAHWTGVEADQKLDMALKSAGLWEIKTPAMQKIKAQLTRLAHLLSMHHDRVLESNVAMLRKSGNPDAIILKMFRRKLAENHDGQMAAIRTARSFAIDVEDVVTVVKEAAARRPFKLNEDGEEDVPIFPVEMGRPGGVPPGGVAPAPTTGTGTPAPNNIATAPPAPDPTTTALEPANQSQSTVRSQSPADMRARNAIAQGNQRIAAATQPPAGQPAQPGQPQPTQPVQPTAQTQQQQPVQQQQQAQPAQPPQGTPFQPPGRVVNNPNAAVRRAPMRG
jgi:hypothetical protein